MKTSIKGLAIIFFFASPWFASATHTDSAPKRSVPEYGPMPPSPEMLDPRLQDPNLDDEKDKHVIMNADTLYAKRKARRAELVAEAAKDLIAESEAKDHASAAMSARFTKAEKRYRFLEASLKLMESKRAAIEKKGDVDDLKEFDKDIALLQWKLDKIRKTYEAVYKMPPVRPIPPATAIGKETPEDVKRRDLFNQDVVAKADELRHRYAIGDAHDRKRGLDLTGDYSTGLDYPTLDEDKNGRINMIAYRPSTYYYRNRKGEIQAGTKWKKVTTYLASADEQDKDLPLENDWMPPGSMVAMADLDGHLIKGGRSPSEKFAANFVAAVPDEVETDGTPDQAKPKKELSIDRHKGSGSAGSKTASTRSGNSGEGGDSSHARGGAASRPQGKALAYSRNRGDSGESNDFDSSRPTEKKVSRVVDPSERLVETTSSAQEERTSSRMPFHVLQNSLKPDTKYALTGEKEDFSLSAMTVRVNHSREPGKTIYKSVPYTFEKKLMGTGEAGVALAQRLFNDEQLADKVLAMHKNDLTADNMSSKAKRMTAFRTIMYNKIRAIRVDAADENGMPYIEQPGDILVWPLKKSQKAPDYDALSKFMLESIGNEADPKASPAPQPIDAGS